MNLTFILVLLTASVVLMTSCSTSRSRPCSEGGQPPRETSIPFKGTKRCFQVKDESGKYVNHGKYFEWFGSEKIAITGEYKLGKKSGRWIEYDETGKKISDKYYDEGKEIPRP
jgi:hypothetical protein